jgi:uncharacterized protein (UPF0332 family)
VDGKCFLGTAQFLLSGGADEAAYRSAVSRAYYACFPEARQVAFDHCGHDARRKARIRTERDILHEKLQFYLKMEGGPEAIRKLGENLAGLYGKRKEADYDMRAALSSADARDAIEEARAFLRDLAQASPAAVGKAMERHISATHPPVPAAPAP